MALSKIERHKIDEALSEFFFGCNIPFSVIESEHFRKFVSVLKPTYKVPTRKTLSNTLLNNAHDKIIDERSRLKESDGVILIDGWKNSSANTKNVVCTILSNEKHMFLGSWDLTSQKENAATLEKIVQEAAQMAKEKYNVNIYSVISDNASTMISMGRSIDFWHTTCHSHSGNLLAKSLVEHTFAEAVHKVVKEFKNPALEREVTEREGKKNDFGL